VALTAESAAWSGIGIDRVRRLVPRVVDPSPSQPLFEDTGVSGMVMRTDIKKLKDDAVAARKLAKQLAAAGAKGIPTSSAQPSANRCPCTCTNSHVQHRHSAI
jgi:hypothetical protein